MSIFTNRKIKRLQAELEEIQKHVKMLRAINKTQDDALKIMHEMLMEYEKLRNNK